MCLLLQPLPSSFTVGLRFDLFSDCIYTASDPGLKSFRASELAVKICSLLTLAAVSGHQTQQVFFVLFFVLPRNKSINTTRLVFLFLFFFLSTLNPPLRRHEQEVVKNVHVQSEV